MKKIKKVKLFEIIKASKENPDLTLECIKKLLQARQEAEVGNVTPYEFYKNKKIRS